MHAGAGTGGRRAPALIAFFISIALGAVSSARADVDLTGDWDLVGFNFQVQVTIGQSGSALTVDFPTPPPAVGTIDPTNGLFSFSRTDPCGTSTFDGTAAADGN